MEKRSIIISGLVIAVALLLLVIGCDTGGSEGVYAIGDTGPSSVGIVFYITDGGLHGLEAAPSDQSVSQVWITGGTTQTTANGNTSTGIGIGLSNSNVIIAQVGHTGSAAKVAKDYNGGILTDWFLPSRDELAQLYAQRAAVGGFADEPYWSSSEYNSTYAWLHDFSNNMQTYGDKGFSTRVRAVRAF